MFKGRINSSPNHNISISKILSNLNGHRGKYIDSKSIWKFMGEKHL